MATDAFTYIEGLYIGKAFPEDAVRSTIAYEPRPGDLFIVTYPKCGTSWMQQIVYNILTDGNIPEDKTDAVLRLPFLEIQGADAATHSLKPGAFKTHLPFWLNPYSPDAKYIYVARNPYDCCVSFYHHTKNFAMYHYEDGTFDDFLDKFVDGKVDFGDYFDHLLSWYEHRHDPNVLFLTFEQIKRDPRASILRVAEFMGDAYGAKLRDDEALLKKNHKRQWHPALVKGFEAFKAYFAKPMKGDFARKGVVGDWKKHFSDDHVAKMKRYIASKTAGSDVMSLWPEIPVN
ncbi:hypothetical protein MRX96_001905 [Rhipicephalus microplus]